MPKAEVGSTKYVANKMKAKGLQRLRWYCQVCSKQCRDENGFKQHTLSEGHVRQMMLVGENPGKYIHNFSSQFKRDFLQLLRTSHGEKKVYINHFYQEYIRDKEHVHMNSTRWSSLTEFAKFLGREGVCRVEEGERGLQIQWIDDSPEAIKRREDIKNKDKQAKGDEDLESRLLAQQIRKAKQQEGTSSAVPAPESIAPPPEAQNEEPVKISFALGGNKPDKPSSPVVESSQQDQVPTTNDDSIVKPEGESASGPASTTSVSATTVTPTTKVSLSLGSTKPRVNPLMAKKDPFAKKVARAPEPEKKMSNAERIMREEIERKRRREEWSKGNESKRARYD